jgi:SAM-dependent methyltransferase
MARARHEYAGDVAARDVTDWEKLALREPYFPILTDEGALGVPGSDAASAAFFESGEQDIASLLAAIGSVLGREIALTASFDFGCGAGRLTLPLARRASSVVACDTAPTLLAHARKNATDAGLRNVTFITPDKLTALPPASIDFVCSLLVFEHIPPAAGYELIRALVVLIAPKGIAALHVPFGRPGGRLRRLARWSRNRLRPTNDAQSSTAKANHYDQRLLQRYVEAAGGRVVAWLGTRGNGNSGVLVIEKP